MKTLRNAQVGSKVRVKKIRGRGALKRRIMEMGLTQGIEVLVQKEAPLGDPIELNIRGYNLALRRSDAALIEIEGETKAAPV